MSNVRCCRQARVFQALGLWVASYPVIVGLVSFVVFVGIGFGTLNAVVEQDLDALWVQKGTRLEGEQKEYESHFGKVDERLVLQIQSRDGKPAYGPEAMQYLFEMQKDLMDFTEGPSFRDPFGLRSGGQLSNLNYTYKGHTYGFRDICDEPFMGKGAPLRVGCIVLSPTYCFREATFSDFPVGPLLTALDTFNAAHPFSISNESDYLGALNSPCVWWTQKETFKAQVFGTRKFENDNTSGTALSAELVGTVHSILPAESFVKKLQYIRGHSAYTYLYPLPLLQLITAYLGFNAATGWMTDTTALTEVLTAMGGYALYYPEARSSVPLPLANFLPNYQAMLDQIKTVNVTMGSELEAGFAAYSAGFLPKSAMTLNMTVLLDSYPMSLTTDEVTDIIYKLYDVIGDHIKAKNAALPASNNLDVSYYTSNMLTDVIEEASRRHIGMFLISILAMWAYAIICIAFQNCTSLVRIRLALSLWTVLTVIISIWASTGVAALIGIPWTMASIQVLPFLALGLGIDDSFVLLWAFPTKNPLSKGQTIKEKAGQALATAGPSVLLTSAANFCCFLFAMIIPIQSMQYFAAQAALAVLFNFLGLIFIFFPAVILDCLRQEASRYDCMCCFIGQLDQGDQDDADLDAVESTGSQMAQKILNFWPARLGVICIFLAFTAVNAFLVKNLERGLSWSHFVVEDTALHNFLSSRDLHFPIESNNLVFKGQDYSSETVQINIKNMLTTIQTMDTPEGYNVLGSFWLFTFHKAMKDQCDFVKASLPAGSPCLVPDVDMNYNSIPNQYIQCYNESSDTVPQATFYKCLSNWGFGKYPTGGAGGSDLANIIFEREANDGFINKIIISKLRIFNDGCIDNESRIRIMQSYRAFLDDQKAKNLVECYAYGGMYRFNEQYIHLWATTVKILCIGIAAVFAMAVLFVWNIPVALAMAFVIACLLIDTMAIMYYMSIPMNSVSLLNNVFGLGLFVEYTGHFCQAFVAGEGTAPQRARNAGSSVFVPVLHGGITSFVSVIVLAFSNVQFFRIYFFGMFTWMIVLGLINGLIFLPTLLACLPSSLLSQGANQVQQIDVDAHKKPDEEEASSAQMIIP